MDCLIGAEVLCVCGGGGSWRNRRAGRGVVELGGLTELLSGGGIGGEREDKEEEE